MWKNPKGVTLIKTKSLAIEIHQFIQSVYFSPKPILCITNIRKFQLLWSYTFSKSNLHNIPLSFHFNIKSIASLAIKAVPRICLLSMKAFWVEDTTFFSLLANTFSSSLYKPPTKLINLKSLKLSTPHFFGTKTKNIEFKLLTNLPHSWKSLKKSIISTFTKFQQNYQNAIKKSFGSSALSPFSSERAKNTSSTVKGLL